MSKNNSKNTISSRWNSLSKVRKINTSLLMLFVLILGLLPAAAATSTPACRINFAVDVTESITSASRQNPADFKAALKSSIAAISNLYPNAQYSFTLFASRAGSYVPNNGAYWIGESAANSRVDSIEFYDRAAFSNWSQRSAWLAKTFPYSLANYPDKSTGTNWEEAVKYSRSTQSPNGIIMLTDGNPTTDLKEMGMVQPNTSFSETDNGNTSAGNTGADASLNAGGTEFVNAKKAGIKRFVELTTRDDSRKARGITNLTVFKGYGVIDDYDVTSTYPQLAGKLTAWAKDICAPITGQVWTQTFQPHWDSTGHYLGYNKVGQEYLPNFTYTLDGETQTSRSGDVAVSTNFLYNLSKTNVWSVKPNASYTIKQTSTDNTNTIPYDRYCWNTSSGLTPTGQFDGNSKSFTVPVLTSGFIACHFVQAKAAITLDKVVRETSSPTSPIVTNVVRGQKVYYHFVVKNIGTAPLNNITVSDPMLGGNVQTKTGTLYPNQTWTLTPKAYTIDNAASGTITNTATVSGQPLNAQGEAVSSRVSDKDSASVNVKLTSSYTFDKTANKVVVKAGDTVTYTFKITNTGQAPISNATITDNSISPKFSKTGISLAPGEAKSYTATYTIPSTFTGDTFVNTATATVPNLASKTDTWTVYIPRIQLDKTLVDNAGNPVTTLTIGGQYKYKFSVTNTGGTALGNVKVTDADLATKLGLSAINLSVGNLAVNETKTVYQPFTLTAAIANRMNPAGAATFTYRNVATTTGNPYDRGTLLTSMSVSDTDDHTVTVNRTQSFTFNKTVTPSIARPGDTVRYTFSVTNTGQAVLPSATITDSTIGYTGTVAGPIAVGQTKSVSTDYVIPANFVGTQFPNTASATIPGVGTKTDNAVVNIPKIQLEKSGPSVVRIGDTITYSFKVTNTGATPLTNAVVTDQTLDNLFGTNISIPVPGTLAVGQSTTVYYTTPVVTSAIARKIDPTLSGSSNFVNTANVTGYPVDGSGNVISSKPVSDTDDHTVELRLTTAWTFNKSVNKNVENVGNNVTYTFTVTNTGQTILDDVSINDPVLAYNGVIPGPIDPGQTKSINVTVSLPQDNVDGSVDDKVVNVATATVVNPSTGLTSSITDDATVYIPSISLIKDGPTKLVAGQEVTYTFSATNTGGTVLKNVVISDDTLSQVLGSPVTFNVGTLAVNQTVTRTKTFTVTTAIIEKINDLGLLDNGYFVNKADVVGNPVDPVTGSTLTSSVTADAEHYAVIETNPNLSITKTASPTVVKAGDSVTFTIVVKNTGDTNLTNVLVEDTNLGFSQTISLNVGESKTFTLTKVVSADDLSSGKYTNVACATSDSIKECATDTVYEPSISIVKSSSPEDTVRVGDDLRYKFVVTNTGATVLHNVVVTDDDLTALLGTNVSVNVGTLAVGESKTVYYPASGSTAIKVTTALFNKLVAASEDGVFTNTAKATGIPVNPETGSEVPSTPVTDTDTDDVTPVSSPGLSITKTVNTAVINGDTTSVTYTLVVKNTGDTDLANISVVDSKIGIDQTVASLAAGASTTISKTVNVDTLTLSNNTFVNEACASTATLNDCDTANIYKASIEVVKSSSPEDDVNVGDDLRYKFVVTNTGATVLHDVVVTDDDLTALLGTNVSVNVGTLAVGESKTVYYPASGSTAIKVTAALFDKLVAASENGVFTNTAKATGVPVNPETGTEVPSTSVTDTDTDDVKPVSNPGFTITKTVSPAVAKPGDEVTFTIVVTNTGDVNLSNVVVTDVKLPGFPKTVSVDVGKSATIVVKHVMTEEDLTSGTYVNTACAESGTIKVCDDVSVLKSSIELIKTGPASAFEGNEVTYDFVVKNTGSVPLTNIVVTDDTYSKLFPARTVDPIVINIAGTLEPGATSAVQHATITLDNCLYTQTSGVCFADVEVFKNGEFKNIASVKANPIDPTNGQVINTTVTDTDDHIVNQIKWSITKTASPANALPGEEVTYTIVVKNTGNAVIPELAVTDYLDSLGGSGATNLGTVTNLAVGAEQSFTYKVTIPKEYTGIKFVNTATACLKDAIANANTGNGCEEDDATVYIPKIQIIKTANTDTAKPGDTVRYSFEVKNIGGVTLDPDPVTDNILGTIGDPKELKPGESQTLTKDYVVPDDVASVINVAVVTAPVPGRTDLNVTDDDDHTLSVSETPIVTPTTFPDDVLDTTQINSNPLPFTGSMAERLVKTSLWLLAIGGIGIFFNTGFTKKNRKQKYSL